MKSDLRLTSHAIARMSQRGLTESNIELIRLIGTDVGDGPLVRKKDYQAFVDHLKHLEAQARKLIGKRVVEVDGCVVTAYHATRGKERRLLRGARDRSLSR